MTPERSINSMDPKEHNPSTQSQAGENDPQAAAAARARIAALSQAHPLASHGQPVPEPAPQPTPVVNPVHQPPSTTRKLPSKIKPIITAVAFFALLFLVFKSPVLLSQIGYLLGDKPQTSETPTVATPAVAETVSQTPSLIIPKININAPIVFEPSISEAKIQSALQGGVVHYGNTPKPGRPGNAVVVGHSSNDWWEPGSYKFVFVLLDKLVPGDTFNVHYEGKNYIYQVAESKVVEPNDLSVLAPTREPTITLITCTPPGTSWKRLIIKAHQISPAPETVEVPQLAGADESGQGSLLPGNAPSFLEQLAKIWGQIKNAFASVFNGSDKTDTELPQTLPKAL